MAPMFSFFNSNNDGKKEKAKAKNDKDESQTEDDDEKKPVSDNKETTAEEEVAEVDYSNPYHPHLTSNGYFTQHGIKMWIAANPEKYKKEKAATQTLNYDPDPSKSLYFWQLYSLLGKDKLHKLISVFYHSIYNDKNAKNKWFRKAFSRIGSVDHHIRTQSAFWMDAFGAGERYHGGAFRLNWHHEHKASAVMTEQGAHLWMEFMRKALDSNDVDLTKDKRVRPAINEFLQLLMNKYGHDFKFNTENVKYN